MRLHACARRGVELPAIALVTAGVLVFNGCAAVPAPVATVTSTTTAVASAAPSDPDTVEPTPDSTPSTNVRGNIPKLLGEEAQLVDGNGNLAVTFKVTKIEAGFKCNSGYADRSENGHYVAVWMEISTTKAVDFDSSDANVVPYFNPGDWHVIAPDGTTENDSSGNGYSCARDSVSLPSQLGPGKKVKGVVVLDTKYKRGHLALIQDYMDSGWEWKF